MTILLLSYAIDPHLARIQTILEGRSADYFVFNGLMFPHQSSMSIFSRSQRSIPSDAKSWKDGETSLNNALVIETTHGKIYADDVTSVWNRRRCQSYPYLQDDPAMYLSVKEECNLFLDTLYPMLSDRYWLSVPSAIRYGSCKPYQQKFARKVGFTVPPSYFGNSVQEAREFVESHGDDFALKGIESHFNRLKPWWKRLFWTPQKIKYPSDTDRQPEEHPYFGAIESFYIPTRRLNKQALLDHLRLIKNCPLIIQPYVKKAFELRVTVVGDRVFACKIESYQGNQELEDWREGDTDTLPHTIFQLPPQVEHQCVQLVSSMGLAFGCIDLIVTPEGDYVFLEINPNGQWLWVEEKTNLPIAEAIADLLIQKNKTG